MADLFLEEVALWSEVHVHDHVAKRMSGGGKVIITSFYLRNYFMNLFRSHAL